MTKRTKTLVWLRNGHGDEDLPMETFTSADGRFEIGASLCPPNRYYLHDKKRCTQSKTACLSLHVSIRAAKSFAQSEGARRGAATRQSAAKGDL